MPNGTSVYAGDYNQNAQSKSIVDAAIAKALGIKQAHEMPTNPGLDQAIAGGPSSIEDYLKNNVPNGNGGSSGGGQPKDDNGIKIYPPGSTSGIDISTLEPGQLQLLMNVGATFQPATSLHGLGDIANLFPKYPGYGGGFGGYGNPFGSYFPMSGFNPYMMGYGGGYGGGFNPFMMMGGSGYNPFSGFDSFNSIQSDDRNIDQGGIDLFSLLGMLG